MSRATLSACLIVRDAGMDLDWCLQSLVGEVDEIVIVDTGSQDRTRTIARRYVGHVHRFAWQEDFSAARNFALSKAHGTWVFFPDSDECLAGERGALRRAVRAAEGLGERALSVMRREVDERGQSVGMPDNPAVRILRRGCGLAYHEAVHEVLLYPDGRSVEAPLVPADELYLWHRGYAPSRKAAKAARNIAILERIEQAGGQKHYLHYYLAGLYADTGRYADACREAELSIAKREHPPEGALEVWRSYLQSVEALGDAARLEALSLRVVEEAPELPDAYARLGVAAMNREDFAAGERWLRAAIEREAAFPAACPQEYDSFRAALPQAEELRAARRPEPSRRSAGRQGTEGEGQEERMAKKRKEQAEVSVKVTLPRVAEASPEEQAAERLAGLLPPAAETVVIFGCGDGAAARIFLRRAPGARVYGFASSRAEAVAAGRVMTGAYAASPAEADLAAYGLSDVDCIFYAPAACGQLTEACLARHAEALAADGQMCFLAPNPAYLGRMAGALAGDGSAACSPLWISRVLRGIGFARAFVQPEAGAEEAAQHADAQAREAAAKLAAYAQAQGEHVQQLDPFVPRYVVRAGRQAQPSLFVHAFLGEEIVTARPRVWEPEAFLQTEPGVVAQSARDRMSQGIAQQMEQRIVIRQRKGFVNDEEADRVTKDLRAAGDVLVYEMDDNPCLFYSKEELASSIDFAGVHVVQVSTPALAEVIRPYNPHVGVFENQLKELPPPRDDAAEAAARDGRVTVFFGAINREEDYDDIVPALDAAAEKYGDRLFFRVLADVQFYQKLSTPYKEFVADPEFHEGRFVPYEAYQRVLHTADISLLPLHDTEFNRTKSDLKFIESAGHGAVVLASPTVYEQSVVDGCTGCIYRSPEEFAERLARLIEDAPYRQAIARAAYGYVKGHRLLSQHYRERIAAYHEMAAHFAELDRDLAARLKKMGRLA